MNDTTKKCPMCAEEIRIEATTCEYCGAQFEVTSTGYCQNCHEVRNADENGQCNVCGNKVLDFRVESKFIEEPVQESVLIAQPEIRKAGKSFLSYGILAAVLIFGVIGALLWLARNGLPAFPGLSATITPTSTVTSPTTPTQTLTRTPRPSPTPTPTPAWVKDFWQPSIDAIANRSPDFQDDFSQNSVAWSFSTGPDRNRGKMEIVNGVLIMNVDAGYVGFATHSKMRFEDFILRVNIKLEQLSNVDAAAEIDWRGASDGGEVFSIWKNGRWQVAYCESEGCATLASGQVSLLSSKLVSVTIISRGTDSAVFLNSTPLSYINDTGRRPGKNITLSLWVNDDSPTAVAVQYDGLKVWNLSGVTIATPVPVVLPTLTQAANTPASGSGAAEGRIMWNGQPMPGVSIKFCPALAAGGCKSGEYTAISDSDGRYTIAGLAAGKYELHTRLEDQEDWTWQLGKIVSVVAGEIITVDYINVSKSDLKLSSPANNTTVATAMPTLEWEPYPGAAYYEVFVLKNQPLESVVDEKVSVSQYIFKKPLAAGKYSWDIQAYNAAGIKISESGSYYFTVGTTGEIDLSNSYTVTGTNPNGSSYRGNVLITKNGPLYDIVWRIAGETMTGSGVFNGQTLSVHWTGPDGQGKGTANYILQPNGTLLGTWHIDGQQEQGTETLTP